MSKFRITEDTSDTDYDKLYDDWVAYVDAYPPPVDNCPKCNGTMSWSWCVFGCCQPDSPRGMYCTACLYDPDIRQIY